MPSPSRLKSSSTFSSRNARLVLSRFRSAFLRAILAIKETGQPQQNACIKRHNRTVRHEWLDQYIIETIEEAQEHATQWLWTYNNDRPNMGIGGIIPAQKLKMVTKALRMHPAKNGDYRTTSIESKVSRQERGTSRGKALSRCAWPQANIVIGFSRSSTTTFRNSAPSAPSITL